MGSNQSSIITKPSQYQQKLLHLPPDFSKSKFAKARTCSTISKVLKKIAAIGTCINNTNPESIPKTHLDRICFITINTYHRPDYQLGIGPLNDSYLVAANHHRRGYRIFYLYNATRDEFINFATFFIKFTVQSLTIFYSGRCTKLGANRNGKIEGYNNAMVFEQGYFIDPEMGSILSENAKGNLTIVLISDCCKGGTIWDLDAIKKDYSNLPTNIVSISAVEISEITLQGTSLKKNTDGIFTYFFWEITNTTPNIALDKLEERINPKMERFNLKLVYGMSANDLYEKPIFS